MKKFDLKFDSKKLRIFTSPKRTIGIILFLLVVVPPVVLFADAAYRTIDEFFEDGGWDYTARKYAWFAYNNSDYGTLGNYLADESYSTGVDYDTWYGAGSENFSTILHASLNSMPTPNSASSAQSFAYNGFSRQSFAPILMGIAHEASPDYCESGYVGSGYYRVINFESFGWSPSISEEGLSEDEINALRIRYFYYKFINQCNKYSSKWNYKFSINYCSLPLMRVIESMWDESALTVSVLPKNGKIAGKVYTDKEFEKYMSVIDLNTNTVNELNLDTKFPHAYRVMSQNGDICPYLITPAKVTSTEHNIIDTGSVYNFEPDDKTEDDLITANDYKDIKANTDNSKGKNSEEE